MVNPWENLDLEIYQNYTKSIKQYQKLNQIMKGQCKSYNFKSVAIWGAGDGNGLEYLSCKRFKNIYAIDINEEYLKECENKNSNLECLHTEKIDLSDTFVELPHVNMVIADLIIEFLGVDTFISQIKNQLINNGKSSKPLKIISCVIENKKDTFDSNSKYANELTGISNIWKSVDELGLIVKLAAINFDLDLKEVYTLGNKEFIRLDFKQVKNVPDDI